MFQLPVYAICAVVGLAATDHGSRGDSDAQSNRPVDVVAVQPSTDEPVAAGDQDQLAKLARRFTTVGSPPQPDVAAQTGAPGTLPDAAESGRFGDDTPLGPRRPGRSPDTQVNADSAEPQWWLRTLAALGAVIGLILLLRAVMSKASGRPVATTASPVFEVLTRTSIAPRNHLLLIRLGQRILVVGQSPAGLHTLANMDDGEEGAELLRTITAAGERSATSGFAQLFKRFNSEYRQEQRVADEGADESEYHIDRARDRVSGLVGQLRSFGAGGRRS